MKANTGYFKGFIYITLTLGIVVIAVIFSQYVLFSGESLSVKEIVISILFLIMVLICSLVLMRSVHLSMYFYIINQNQIVIKKLIRKYTFSFGDITSLIIRDTKLSHGPSIWSITTKGHVITISSENHSTTILIDPLTKEKEIIKTLKWKVPTSIRN